MEHDILVRGNDAEQFWLNNSDRIVLTILTILTIIHGTSPMAVFEGTYQVLGSPRFAIVISRFNDLITTKLLEGCQDCLRRHGVDPNPDGVQVDYAWVPGSFEIPLVAAQLAASRRYAAIICLGAVIRGQTPHFDYVAAEVTKGIATAAMQTGVPIVYGILTTDTMQQALERAGIKSNKGWEYALNALEMANLLQALKLPPGIESAQLRPGATLIEDSWPPPGTSL